MVVRIHRVQIGRIAVRKEKEEEELIKLVEFLAEFLADAFPFGFIVI